MKYLSYNDGLTGLYNRAKYEHDIKHFEEREDRTITCIYLDVVGLHEINNHLGHQAGDTMLTTVADELRRYFSLGLIYRIGGDEFVILHPDVKRSAFSEAIHSLRNALHKKEYEVSIGISDRQGNEPLIDTINRAEDHMRQDKAEFYRKQGNLRQMRNLNMKLEKMLLEKRDAAQFLTILAPRFKGVYVVNMVTDDFRYIYIPPYFQEMFERHEHKYRPSLQEYFQVLVSPAYQYLYEKLKNYDYVQKKLEEKGVLSVRYRKKDGQWVVLSVFPYQSETNVPKTLWIFTDEDKQI